MKQFDNWLARWRLRRIIKVLSPAVGKTLKKEVIDFAQRLSATSNMASTNAMKKDAQLTINCTRRELALFIWYVSKLHEGKASLLYRAYIGLATLAVSDKHILGVTPEEFIKSEKPKAKSSKSSKRIQRIK